MSFVWTGSSRGGGGETLHLSLNICNDYIQTIFSPQSVNIKMPAMFTKLPHYHGWLQLTETWRSDFIKILFIYGKAELDSARESLTPLCHVGVEAQVLGPTSTASQGH